MLNARIKQLRSAMAQHAQQALLITHLPNVRYLCGFTGSSGALLITADRSRLFTDGRYRRQAREEVQGAPVVIGKKAPALQAAEWLAAHERGRIALGMEGEHVTVATQAAIRRELPPRVRIKPVSSIVERQRIVKVITELARLR